MFHHALGVLPRTTAVTTVAKCRDRFQSQEQRAGRHTVAPQVMVLVLPQEAVWPPLQHVLIADNRHAKNALLPGLATAVL